MISNAGTPSKGLSSVMDLFSADGGTAIASMLEGLAQSPEGKKLLEKFVNKPKMPLDPGEKVSGQERCRRFRRDNEQKSLLARHGTWILGSVLFRNRGMKTCAVY